MHLKLQSISRLWFSFLSCGQEERSRLHAEMAKMQSLEEEALLKGTLAIQGLDSSSSSPVKPKGSMGSENSMSGAGGSPNRDAHGGGLGEDAEEPQTDGDETDDYSDQVLTAQHHGEASTTPSSSLDCHTAAEPSTI